MKIDNIEINAELIEVLQEVQSQTQYLKIIKDIGDDIMVTCPYHKDGQERRPSAGIRKNDGTFHCFTCGTTRTLPEMITHCFGQDENTSNFGWAWLLRNFATVEREERKSVELDFTRNFNNSGINNAIHYVGEEELDSYRYFHPYMYERGLTDEVIELFDIGYDRETQCITFPVRDIIGNCLFVARRSVNYKYFNYPSGVEKPLYGLYECLKFQYNKGGLGEVIVTESMLDALSFWTIGKYAVALNGTGNELQFKQLKKLPCRKLILATDSDEAGMKARKRIKQSVNNKIITEYEFPEGRKDANECTKEELKNLLEIF